MPNYATRPRAHADAATAVDDGANALGPAASREDLSSTLVFGGPDESSGLSQGTAPSHTPSTCAPDSQRRFASSPPPQRGPGPAAAGTLLSNASLGAVSTAPSSTPAAAPVAVSASTASTNEKEECLVCQADDMPATIRLACCNAAAHIQCLARWLRRSQKCPHCRSFLREPEINESSSAASTTDELDRVDTALLDDEDEENGMRVEHTTEPRASVPPAGLDGNDEVERRFRQFQRRMRAPRASPRPVLTAHLSNSSNTTAPSPHYFSQNGSLAGPASGAASPQPPPGAPPPILGVTDGASADGTPPRWVGGYRANMRGPSVSMEDLSLGLGAAADDEIGASVSQGGFESGSFVRHGVSSTNNSASTFGNGHQGPHAGLTPPVGYAQAPTFHPHQAQQQQQHPGGGAGPAAAAGGAFIPMPMYATSPVERHTSPGVLYLQPSGSGGYYHTGGNGGGGPSAGMNHGSSGSGGGSGQYGGSGSGGGGGATGGPPPLGREPSSGVFAPALPQQNSSQCDAFGYGGGGPLPPHQHHRQASMQSLQSEYAANTAAGMRQVSVNDSFARDGTYRPNPYGPPPNPVE